MSVLTDIHPEKEAFLQIDGVKLFDIERSSSDEADQVHERKDSCTGAERNIEISCIDVQILSHWSTHSELSIQLIVDSLRETTDGIVLNSETELVRSAVVLDCVD